jgi:DNA-binding MurR/RpiR family transcriptional regulator
MTVRTGQGRKRTAAIAALLTSPTIAHAAQSAGVSESTLTRWLREEGFLREYRLAQREALRQAIATLQAAAGSAVTVLRAAMLDQSATAASRVAAARVVLEFSFRGAEIADLEERLEAIEAKLASADSGQARF